MLNKFCITLCRLSVVIDLIISVISIYIDMSVLYDAWCSHYHTNFDYWFTSHNYMFFYYLSASIIAVILAMLRIIMSELSLMNLFLFIEEEWNDRDLYYHPK